MIIKNLARNPIQKYRKSNLLSYGNNVSINKNVHFQGNIECGNNVSIGQGAYAVSSLSKNRICDYAVFGQNVTSYTGPHLTHIIGKHISEVTAKEKAELILDLGDNPWDKDVFIEMEFWIRGPRAIIGAGAVATHDFPPYSATAKSVWIVKILSHKEVYKWVE